MSWARDNNTTVDQNSTHNIEDILKNEKDLKNSGSKNSLFIDV